MSYRRIEETPETRKMKRDASVAFLTGGVGAFVSSLLMMYEMLSKFTLDVEKGILTIAPALLGFGYMIYARHKLDRALKKETRFIEHFRDE